MLALQGPAAASLSFQALSFFEYLILILDQIFQALLLQKSASDQSELIVKYLFVNEIMN